MESRAAHWDAAYAGRPNRDLSWFEKSPALSLELVTAHLKRGEPFIDVGGGSSKLTDCLLADGYGPLTVLDVSPMVVAAGKARLGEAVDWIVADVTRWAPDKAYAVWHDRAVFHFLTESADRSAYIEALRIALMLGGAAIIGTFDEKGPEMCSGLPVVRYSPQDLADLFDRLASGSFETIDVRRHEHVTPKRRTQSFQFSVFRKVAW